MTDSGFMNCDWASVDFYSLYDHVMHCSCLWTTEAVRKTLSYWIMALCAVTSKPVCLSNVRNVRAVDFSSLLPLLSKLKHVVGNKFRINVCLHKSIKWMSKKKHDENLLVLFLICFCCAQNRLLNYLILFSYVLHSIQAYFYIFSL